MAIDTPSKEYEKFYPKWKLINDVVDQENLNDHLIYLNKHDESEENKNRNKAYKERAVFYALTTETVNGMVGTVFSKAPDIEIPAQLDYVKTNIDGLGNSIFQQSQEVTKNVTSISRAGLYVSFPKTDGPVSKADINNGTAVATTQKIDADRIIKYGIKSTGSKLSLSIVVFKDVITTIEDYDLIEKDALRELYLEDNIYKERLWTKNDKDEWIPGKETIPLDKSGAPLDFIPFQFVGSVNNDPKIDNPNMLGMSTLNIAHFRNSADFEDNVWYIGQSQSWMSGVNQGHIDLMKANNMYVGSREMIAVPDGGSFGIESAPSNPLVRQAMIDKVDMMIGLGARMIRPGGVAKTREQTLTERQVQHSTMTLIVENVNDAYTTALGWMELFMVGSISEKAIYSISLDFIDPEVDANELREIITGFLSSAIPVGDFIRNMKEKNIFDKTKLDNDYIEELEINPLVDLGAE